VVRRDDVWVRYAGEQGFAACADSFAIAGACTSCMMLDDLDSNGRCLPAACERSSSVLSTPAAAWTRRLLSGPRLRCIHSVKQHTTLSMLRCYHRHYDAYLCTLCHSCLAQATVQS
jgi:hypothetical protein